MKDAPGSQGGATATYAIYALPALPLAAIALPLYIIVPSFYASALGLSLASIGTVLLAIRCLDAVTDPLFGWLSDRFSARRGRRRVFFALSLPLTSISAFMLFWPSPDAGLLYLAFWGAALSVGATWSLLPYTAWGAELATDYHERVRLSAFREASTLIGSLLAISLPFVGGIESATGFHGLAWIAVTVAILLPLAGIVAVSFVPEPEDLSRRRLGLFEGLRYVAANGPFLRLALSFLLNSFANAIPASLFLFFVGQRLGAADLQGPLLFSYFLSAVAGIPIAVWVSRRIGKHRAWCLSMALACAVFSFAGFLGQGDIVAFAMICVVTGILLGFDLALPPAIQADVIDIDTTESGEQRSGLYFAAWSFITKLSLALSAGIIFPILAFAGFDASSTAGPQTSQALTTLSVLYAWAPIVPKLAAIAAMWGFSLDEEHQKALRLKLENG